MSNRLPSVAAWLMAATIWMAVIPYASAEKSVTLAWDPSPSMDVAGYYVYSLEENTSTPTRVDAGAQTRATIPGLKEGLRYHFTVTAYNAAGVESLPSNSAVFVVPVPLKLTPARQLQFPVAPGHWYELQVSTNLSAWSTIWQTGVASTYSWVEFQDLQSKRFKQRFYRLQVH